MAHDSSAKPPSTGILSQTYRVCIVKGRRWLASSGLPLWLSLLAVVATLPCVWSGFAADDHFLRMVVQGFPGLEELAESRLDMFTFADGDPGRNHAFIDRGLLPWWAADGVRLAFWRPVTALTHFADFVLWPDAAWLMHFQNILWYAVLVMVVAKVYRRFMRPAWVAGLAALLYALDDAHGMSVGWIASRNAMMSALLGFVALLAHDSWRKTRRNEVGVGAVLAFAAGLVCGEAALSVGGYFLAYAIFLDRGSWVRRLTALLPYAMVVVAWHVLYRHMGYGASGSGIYLDPVRQHGLFLTKAPQHLLVLLLGQFGLPTSGAWSVVPWPWPTVILVFAVIFLVFVSYVIWPLLRRDAVARFWALGAVISAVPACAVVPQDRLLSFVGLGGMGLVAQFLATWFGGPRWGARTQRRAAPARTLAISWIVVHGIVAPVFLPLNACGMAWLDEVIQRSAEGIPNTPEIENMDVVIISAPTDFIAWHMPITRSSEKAHVPRHTWVLSVGLRSAEVRRPDDHTLVVRPEEGFVPTPWGEMFRWAKAPFTVGHCIRLTGLTIQVLSVTQDGRPREVQFRFDAPLEDPSLYFVLWKNGTYRPFELPGAGETAQIAPLSWFWWTEGVEQSAAERGFS